MQIRTHPASEEARHTTQMLRENTMKSISIAAIGLAVAALQACAPAFAAPVQAVVKPTSDGSLYTCAGCNVVDGTDYVGTGGYVQGDVKFSMATLQRPQSQVLLTLNPYAQPLWGRQVDVYGYGTSEAALDVSDADAGTFLGTLVLPDNLGYGQDAFFDVTAFVNGVHAPYVAFNLRSDGTDLFSSLEYNDGHPSELLAIAAPVPEPASAALMLAGAFATAGLAWRRRRTS